MSRSVAQARQNRCLALSRSVFALKMTLWPESGSNLARSGRKFSYGLVSLGGAQIWPPEINENIWNSLLLFQRLLFSRELLYNHINFSPNALTVQTAKNHKESPFSHRRKLVMDAVLVSRRVKSQKFNILYFQNERRYQAENL